MCAKRGMGNGKEGRIGQQEGQEREIKRERGGYRERRGRGRKGERDRKGKRRIIETGMGRKKLGRRKEGTGNGRVRRKGQKKEGEGEVRGEKNGEGENRKENRERGTGEE